MQKKAICQLIDWYREDHRKLPWREKKDPYAIWVSEIMLQQTRVEAVKPYYDRFMAALPTPADLAACPEEKLLKLWEGLGYYNRVRNMQKCARILVEAYDGKLPADHALLLKLPGIGSYTAGAIGSIAFDLPVPAVDGNVLRVWARMKKDASDILSQKTRKQVEAELSACMPEDKAGDFNQAMMELGATVCLPNGVPLCERCPVKDWCGAGREGSWNLYPVKKKARARRIEERTVLLIQDGHRTCLEKRKEQGLLAGLYQFPNFSGYLSEEEILLKVKQYGLDALYMEPLKTAKHIFSHIEWHMKGYRVRIADREYTSSAIGQTDTLVFAETETMSEQYPVPAAFAAYAEYIDLRIGQKKFEEEIL